MQAVKSSAMQWSTGCYMCIKHQVGNCSVQCIAVLGSPVNCAVHWDVYCTLCSALRLEFSFLEISVKVSLFSRSTLRIHFQFFGFVEKHEIDRKIFSFLSQSITQKILDLVAKHKIGKKTFSFLSQDFSRKKLHLKKIKIFTFLKILVQRLAKKYSRNIIVLILILVLVWKHENERKKFSFASRSTRLNEKFSFTSQKWNNGSRRGFIEFWSARCNAMQSAV